LAGVAIAFSAASSSLGSASFPELLIAASVSKPVLAFKA
jgi:hypothetical protein